MTEAERETLALIIGHRVRQVRKIKRLSQDELSNGIGSQSMISLIEGGHQLPLPDVLSSIAGKLGDAVLEGYAESLERNTLAEFSVSSHNEEDLISILVNHRGRWHPAHERIASQLCRHYYHMANFQQVQDLCHLVIHHVSRNGPLAEAYFYLGSSLLQEHKFNEGERWLKLSDSLVDDLNEEMKGRLSYNLGYAYTYLDIQVLAVLYATRAVEIFNRNSDFLNQGNSLGLLGTVQTRLGRLEEAKQTLTTSFDILSRWSSKTTNQSRIIATLAEVCFLLGQNGEAESYAQRAKNTTDEGDLLCKADVFRLLSHLSLHKGDMKQAREYMENGLEVARSVGDPHSLGQLYLLGTQVLEDPVLKLDSARLAFQSTKGTNHHILHALAAECVGKLLEEDFIPEEDSRIYMQAALNSYRTYVHKNSMFTNLIDNLPIYDSYSAEEVPEGGDDGTSGEIPFAGSVKSM